MFFDSLFLETVNVWLNLVCIVVIGFLALKARTLYFAIRTEMTSIGDAAQQVRALLRQNKDLITQSEELIAENRRLWSSYTAAAADADAQRIRFLEEKNREAGVVPETGTAEAAR